RSQFAAKSVTENVDQTGTPVTVKRASTAFHSRSRCRRGVNQSGPHVHCAGTSPRDTRRTACRTANALADRCTDASAVAFRSVNHAEWLCIAKNSCSAPPAEDNDLPELTSEERLVFQQALADAECHLLQVQRNFSGESSRDQSN